MLRFKHKSGEMIVDLWSTLPVHLTWLNFFLSKVDESPDQDQILNEVMRVLRRKEATAQRTEELKLIRRDIEAIQERYGGSYE
jgi:mannitol/fructose-specific phosphotransferase system IIA component (Ntr-type)